MKLKRSKGVTILGWYYIVQGCINALLVLLPSYSGNSIKGLVGPLIGVALGAGLLKLNGKAWAFMIFILLIKILDRLYHLFFRWDTEDPTKSMVILVASLIFIYFLTRPKIIEQFK